MVMSSNIHRLSSLHELDLGDVDEMWDIALLSPTVAG